MTEHYCNVCMSCKPLKSDKKAVLTASVCKCWLLYCVWYFQMNSTAMEQKATMRHLVWETVLNSGKQRRGQPSYGIVTVDSITQQSCVCPHFALWKQGPQQDNKTFCWMTC